MCECKLCKMAYKRFKMKDFAVSNLVMESSRIQKIREVGNDSDIYREEKGKYADIYRLKINSAQDEEEYGCRQGSYITLYTENICKMENCSMKAVASLIAQEILTLIKEEYPCKRMNELSIVVAGIGNRDITADAIGPKTAEKISVTRHVKLVDPQGFSRLGVCSVAAVVCGVMGNTGIETLEILQGTVSQVAPDAIIAIDALSAREYSRLASTVQISNAGISPGAGIGNRRCAIDRQTLGVPVIAIGVPTVVSAATVICNALEACGYDSPNEKMKQMLKKNKRFFMAPKECDIITKRASELLALAIDQAFLGI